MDTLNVMSFGYTNILAIFLHSMNNIFYKFLDNFVVCYLDYTLIFTKNKEYHERNVWLMLKELHNARLYAKLEKCVFHQPQVEFLGYNISREGLFMDPNKI